jgi:hypothetical protein
MNDMKNIDWYYVCAAIAMGVTTICVSPEYGIICGLNWIFIRKAFGQNERHN